MIKPLYTTQLSSAKPRSGLISIADVIPRLIRQYEIQAEFNRQHQPAVQSASPQAQTRAKARNPKQKRLGKNKVPQAASVRHSNSEIVSDANKQITFAWFDG